MQLKEITREIQSNHIILPKNESEITGVNIDSRMVEPGDLFIAMRGTQVDGHKYIAAAEEKGAVAIVCESLPEQINPNVTYIKVADSQAVAGKIATTFYGNPTEKLKLVGVTGTNGKPPLLPCSTNFSAAWDINAAYSPPCATTLTGRPTPRHTPPPMLCRSTVCSAKWPTKAANMPLWK